MRSRSQVGVAGLVLGLVVAGIAPARLPGVGAATALAGRPGMVEHGAELEPHPEAADRPTREVGSARRRARPLEEGKRLGADLDRDPVKKIIRGTRSASLYKPRDPIARRKFVDELMARMTLEEKIGQTNMSLLGAIDINPELERFFTTREKIRAGEVGSILGMADVDEINKLQRTFVEETRLGIPAYFGFDAIHGMFSNFGTNLAFASSFDRKLVRKIYRAIGSEVAAAGDHVAFSPMLDLVRGNPMWGRGMEGYGEDSFWGGEIAVQAVKGLQEQGVAATMKHFAFYAANEGADYGPERVGADEQGKYLYPFEQGFKRAGARAVMWGFGAKDGVPVTGNPELYEIKRTRMGKHGREALGIADWDAVGERAAAGHRVDADLAAAAVHSVENGVDVDMVSHAYVRNLPAEVARAKGKEKRALLASIDDAVRRNLDLKYDLGLFEDPYTDPARVKQVARSPEHQKVALQSALESMVLLKNDPHAGGETPILPLGIAARKIAVVGPLAASQADPRGAWFAQSRPENVTSVLEGMRKHVARGTEVIHAAGGTVERSTPQQIGAAVKAAKEADVTIVVVGEAWGMSGEAQSRSDLGLPGDQQKLVDSIAKTGKPYVVVLMNGRPLAIPEIAGSAPAIVEAWQAGDRTGDALALLLTGKQNFSGKLPVSFPRFAGQKVYYDHTTTGRPAWVADQELAEGVKAGDPYRSRYYNAKQAGLDARQSLPLWVFGEGKSYTTYAYDDLHLSSGRLRARDKVKVSARVSNTGAVAGDEIVQLYVGDDIRSTAPPVKELKGVERIHLEPGESKVVEFTIGRKELSFLDAKLGRKLEPGTFTVWIAPSSVGGLKGKLELTPEK